MSVIIVFKTLPAIRKWAPKLALITRHMDRSRVRIQDRSCLYWKKFNLKRDIYHKTPQLKVNQNWSQLPVPLSWWMRQSPNLFLNPQIIIIIIQLVWLKVVRGPQIVDLKQEIVKEIRGNKDKEEFQKPLIWYWMIRREFKTICLIKIQQAPSSKTQENLKLFKRRKWSRKAIKDILHKQSMRLKR